MPKQAASAVQAPSSAQQAALITQAPIPGSSASSPPPFHVVSLPAQTPPAPHWTAYASAIATPIVAIVAAGIAASIAYRQWRTAQNKLKLDLFEQRYAVFKAASDLLLMMRRVKTVDGYKLAELMSNMQGAEFLFSQDVATYLQGTLVSRALQVLTLKDRKAELANCDQANAVAAIDTEIKEHMDWFIQQSIELRRRMRPYLQLSH